MSEINSHQLALRPAVGLQLLCQTLDELGLEAEQVCKQTELSRRDLDTPGQLIARDDEVRFIEATLAAVDRPDLAFRVGMRYHFGVFGVWGLALATSRDLSQALEVAQEFIELTHSFAGLLVQVQGNQAQIGIEQDYPDGPVQAFVLERDLMVTLMIASEIAGRRLPVVVLACEALGKSADPRLNVRVVIPDLETEAPVLQDRAVATLLGNCTEYGLTQSSRVSGCSRRTAACAWCMTASLGTCALSTKPRHGALSASARQGGSVRNPNGFLMGCPLRTPRWISASNWHRSPQTLNTPAASINAFIGASCHEVAYSR